MRTVFAALTLLAFVSAGRVAAADPQTGASLADDPRVQELEFLAQNRQQKATFGGRLACFIDLNCYKLKRDLIVENNRGYFVSRILVSSEFKSGSRVLQEEQNERMLFARYIGYAVAAEKLKSGKIGFSAGVYDNKNPGYMYRGGEGWSGFLDSLNPLPHYGAPGLVAFEFLAAGPNDEFFADNGTVEMPENPADPKSPLKTYRLAATHYDAGVRRAMVVEVPYDQLKKLLSGKISSLSGKIEYFVRGGFDREVYDEYALPGEEGRARWGLGDIMDDRSRATPSEKAALDAMIDLMLGFEHGEKSRDVVLKTRSEGREQVLALEFQ